MLLPYPLDIRNIQVLNGLGFGWCGPSDKNTQIRKIFSFYIIFGYIRTSIAPGDEDLRQNLLFLFR